MRVLITNATLTIPSGTDTYIRDLAGALRRAGHEVAAYSNILGEAAQILRDAGVTVVDDPAALPWTPDVLHCHHNTEAMTALLHFPAVAAVFVAHGWTEWFDVPPRHPRVRRYVGVDGPTRDVLVLRHEIPAERVRLIPNFVDLERYRPRGPLPARPGRALVLSHYAREDTHLPTVREACARRGLVLDVMGYGVGRPVRQPERVLGDYDIVFAKGRAALEAIAVGAAVVVCDAFGVGPMVTTENVKVLRTLEGSFLDWFSPLGVDALLREIDRYDPADAAEVARWVRSVAGAERAAAELVSLYQQARDELAREGLDPVADARAAAVYLRWLSRHIKENLVERDPFAGLAVRLRNRLTRVPLLAPVLLRLSARIRARWPRG
jgi:hypothetical protein